MQVFLYFLVEFQKCDFLPTKSMFNTYVSKNKKTIASPKVREQFVNKFSKQYHYTSKLITSMAFFFRQRQGYFLNEYFDLR